MLSLLYARLLIRVLSARSSSRSSPSKTSSPSREGSGYSFIPQPRGEISTPINQINVNQNYVPKSVTFTSRNRFVEGTENVTTKNITPIVKSRKILVNSSEKSPNNYPEDTDSGLLIGSKFEYSPISEDTHTISNFTPRKMNDTSGFEMMPVSEPNPESKISVDTIIPKSKLISDEEEEEFVEEEDNTETHFNNSDSDTFNEHILTGSLQQISDLKSDSDHDEKIAALEEENKKLKENQDVLISVIKELTTSIMSGFGYESHYNYQSLVEGREAQNFVEEIKSVLTAGITSVAEESQKLGVSTDVRRYMDQISRQIENYQNNLQKQHQEIMEALK